MGPWELWGIKFLPCCPLHQQPCEMCRIPGGTSRTLVSETAASSYLLPHSGSCWAPWGAQADPGDPSAPDSISQLHLVETARSGHSPPDTPATGWVGRHGNNPRAPSSS